MTRAEVTTGNKFLCFICIRLCHKKKNDASNKARLLSAYNTKAIGKDLPYRPRVVTPYSLTLLFLRISVWSNEVIF
uniref:Uncharacterized protein n=1 Tax=Rhizophagus irregularis (strain DAOM 181602 / DAOM 197198 / MUCL 43194) TaxID=747089 RepID=U9SQN6_RHIID